MAYIGFASLKAKLANKPVIRNPGAVAAAIGRKKYGAHAMAEAAKHKHSLRNAYRNKEK
jgi:hypothetical protein